MRDGRVSKIFARALKSRVIWTWTVTAARGCGFFLILPLILRQLPSEEVGFWYLLSSLTSFVVMLEMGFNPIISRFTSFYLAGWEGVPRMNCAETSLRKEALPPNPAGLTGLLKMAESLYRAIAWMVFAGLVVASLWVYSRYPNVVAQPLNWISLILWVFGNAFSMKSYFWPGVLFGADQVIEYQQIVITSVLLNYVIIVIGVIFHASVLGLVLGQVAFNFYQRWRSRQLFLVKWCLEDNLDSVSISWISLWPMTWRGGVMSFASYFSFGALALSCSQVFNLTTTAEFTLSLLLVMMASGVANTWMGVVYPTLARWNVSADRQAMGRLVWNRLGLQMGTYILICLLALLLAPTFLSMVKAKTNFLPRELLFLLMIAGGFDLLESSLAAVVQNLNKLPFVWTKLGHSVLTFSLSLLLGHLYGMKGFIAAPIACQLLFTFWFVTWWSRREFRQIEQVSRSS